MSRPRPLTETEWLSCAYPGTMLSRLRTADARKLRLFVCACCYRLWNALDERGREAIRAAERWADGLISRAELRARFLAAQEAERQARNYYAARAAKQVVIVRKDWVVNTAWCAVMAKGPGDDRIAEEHYQCRLLRDVFGNPYRPVRLEPSWLTPGVRGLAEEIYEDRSHPDRTLDPERLSILADALEDAGCDSEVILGHCRSKGPHVRGCWVVDRIVAR
jgi:hypothetical protein